MWRPPLGDVGLSKPPDREVNKRASLIPSAVKWLRRFWLADPAELPRETEPNVSFLSQKLPNPKIGGSAGIKLETHTFVGGPRIEDDVRLDGFPLLKSGLPLISM